MTPKKIQPIKTCEVCNLDYTPKKNYQRFCSVPCREKHYSKNIGWVKSNSIGLPTGTVGAMHELKVSVDLLHKGFEVFRSVSQSTSCDLLAMRNGKILRIEVKTNYENPENGKKMHVKPKHPEKHDVLASVYPLSGIVYTPELEKFFE